MTFDSRAELKTIQKNLGEISFEDKRVLVTGGAGFLGSWMCETLLNLGAEVTCIDNFASGQKCNIQSLMGNERFRFIEHDISVPIAMDTHLDYIFEMASRASPFEFEHYPIQILKSNTLGVMVALGIAKKHNARLVYTSTSEVYGNPDIVPTPETYYGNVNPIGPRGCYDEAKRCGEAYVIAYRRQHHLNTRIARIFNTYGPRIRLDGIYGRVIPRFIDQALKNQPLTIFGDGSQTRSFTYVTDQIEGLLRLAALDAAEGQVINIGNVNEITVLELAKKVIHLTGSKSSLSFHPLPEDDPLRRRPDVTKAKEILKWVPKASLEHGLDRTIAWIKTQQDYPAQS
ncbi:UDP-glucuronic acid decarboxylase family protein [Methanoregula sp.]|uniref:UDP-glucuronic acid decarboxylase family protein n=1 Tax=Methanoregula sp. TaxID=2052170 RepID=UPI00236F9464|nr:UDP-glucuronic acid decarboxylase family protein [Methanoregula sp.]MDD1687198.1 SDR family oxidoreductase [Methanoregula sp.]